jgi:hypothetical protein
VAVAGLETVAGETEAATVAEATVAVAGETEAATAAAVRDAAAVREAVA